MLRTVGAENYKDLLKVESENISIQMVYSDFEQLFF